MTHRRRRKWRKYQFSTDLAALFELFAAIAIFALLYFVLGLMGVYAWALIQQGTEMITTIVYERFVPAIRLGERVAELAKITRYELPDGQLVQEQIEVLWGLQKEDITADVDKRLASLQSAREVVLAERAEAEKIPAGDIRR